MKSLFKFNQIDFLCLLIFAAQLSSCQDENLPGGSMADGNIEFRFNLPQTRAIIDEQTGVGSFVDNDEVGLYAYESGNHRYHLLTLKGGHWLPSLKPADLGKNEVILSAFYQKPQTPVESGIQNIACGVQIDQSTADGYQQSDLLGAQYTMTMSDAVKEVPMTFSHLMHRLNITLTGIDTEAPDFAIEVYGRTQGIFDLSAEGTLQPDANSPEEWIIPHKTGNGTYTALIAPQPVDIGVDRIKIVSNGKTYNYKFPEDEIGGSKILESGKETNVTLNFNEAGGEPSDGDFAGKKLWLYGIEREGHPIPVYDEDNVIYADIGSPETFPQGKWFYVFPDNKSTRYLSWQQDYGWYDCDKYNPEKGGVRPGPDDSRMCWAASASNGLYWWMYHNRDYIELYEKEYGADKDTMIYQRPSYKFTGELDDDEIFRFFRKTCRNEGNHPAFGISWFVSGYAGEKGSIPYLTEDAAYRFKGFFNRVFGKDDKIAWVEDPLTKEKFNQVIKDAFRNNRLLTFSVYGTYSHAMTIWGAEFDEQGTVSAIYYVDNNDYYNFEVTGSSTPYQHHRCIRNIVRYQEDILMPILLGTGKQAITDLGPVDLRRDIWENWKKSLNK